MTADQQQAAWDAEDAHARLDLLHRLHQDLVQARAARRAVEAAHVRAIQDEERARNRLVAFMEQDEARQRRVEEGKA